MEKLKNWRPLEERIAVVRYLMEVGPDCGVVEIMITEIIDAFRSGERLKGYVQPLPPYQATLDDGGMGGGCADYLLEEANTSINGNTD